MTVQAPELPAEVSGYARDLARTLTPVERDAATLDAMAAQLRPDALAERCRALDARRAELAAPILEQARADAARLMAEAQRLEAAAPGDPILGLAGDDLARANNLRPFIAEDAERLDLEPLAARVRSAIAAVDRPTLALLVRYAGRRLEGLDARTLGGLERDAARDLRDALSQAAEALVTPEQRAARQRAGDARRKAATIGEWARTSDPGYVEQLRQRFRILS